MDTHELNDAERIVQIVPLTVPLTYHCLYADSSYVNVCDEVHRSLRLPVVGMSLRLDGYMAMLVVGPHAMGTLYTPPELHETFNGDGEVFTVIGRGFYPIGENPSAEETSEATVTHAFELDRLRAVFNRRADALKEH